MSWYRSTSAPVKLQQVTEFVTIDANTIELIKKQSGGDGTQVSLTSSRASRRQPRKKAAIPS